jgi:hypothetical protein
VGHEDQDAEALRRRLYTPGASPADLVAYLDRAGPEEDPPPAPAVRRPRRGLPVGVVIAGAVLALAAGAVATGAAAARSASDVVPSASSVGWTAAPRDPGDVMAAPSVIDGGSRVHAAGTATTASRSGYVYATSRGDTAVAIAGRFGLCVADVLTALPYGFDPGRLPAGERLLLRRVVSTAPRYDGSGSC